MDAIPANGWRESTWAIKVGVVMMSSARPQCRDVKVAGNKKL